MVKTIISLAIAIIPALLLVWYFYRKDKLKKEPKKMIVRAFILGVISIIPAVLAGLTLDYVLKNMFIINNLWLILFIEAFVSAALFEEVSKYAVFRIGIFKSEYFDEVVDGIIYLTIISLGFACLENVLYSAGSIGTGLLRAFTAVPGHAIWSGIMGYYFGLARARKTQQSALFIKGIFFGVLYHGGYDFVLFAGTNPNLSMEYGWLVLLIFPILIGGAIHLHVLIKKALKIDQESAPVVEDGSVQA